MPVKIHFRKINSMIRCMNGIVNRDHDQNRETKETAIEKYITLPFHLPSTIGNQFYLSQSNNYSTKIEFGSFGSEDSVMTDQ